MQSRKQWGQEITEMVLGGLATRQFDTVAKAFGIRYGPSKSAVSRRVVIGLKRDFEALMQTDCSDVIEEILVPLLIEDRNLRRFFSTTNPLESLFSTLRLKTGRVRRWRNANSVMHWISTAYRQQKKNLQRVRGYKNINELFKLRSRLARVKKRMNHIGLEGESRRRAA